MGHIAFRRSVVPGRLELPTSTLSVWRSNQLSYRTLSMADGRPEKKGGRRTDPPTLYLKDKERQHRNGIKAPDKGIPFIAHFEPVIYSLCRKHLSLSLSDKERRLQKGGVPAAPSGTATLLRLSPNHQFRPRPTLAVTDFRRPRLSWLDGRCVQGPGTYSPRHG